MAKAPSEFYYDIKELVAMFLKDAEIHEGLWMIQAQFVMAGGNFGPSENEILPGALVGVQKVGVKRVQEKGPMVFDAAELNPN